MGIATPPPLQSLTKYNSKPQIQKNPNSTIPMSQDYHHQQGIFNFPNGFDRAQQEQQQQQHVMQQIPSRDKLRVQGFEPPPPLVAVEEEEIGGLPGYETAGMLSEMFNFPPGPATSTEFLDGRAQISPPPPTEFRNTRPLSAGEWYGNRHPHQPHHQIPNADSAAAMHLFLINPQQPRSPSPSPQENSSTLHMLLPNPSPTSALQSFHSPIAGGGGGGGHFGQFTWVPDQRGHEGGQGLSLSLSSLEAVKGEDQLRMGDGGGGGMLFFNQGGGGAGPGGSISGSQYPNRISSGIHQNNYHQIHQVGFGNSSSMGLGGGVNVLRNSKYAKAAQELLEEFCSVGRGQFKKNKFGKHNNSNSNPNNPGGGGGSGGGGGGQSSSKDVLPPLSATDRVEHQRRKVKLLSMVDEVERRYNHYCEQMQMVVNSFDLVMGFGSAVPYTALAQKAMSRHFRCLKDTISAQLKHSCELLGEKDAGTSGVTKGETPRLKLLEQSLRQQRAFHQMGGMMMDQEAWRPQRGLPERSVNILRAWLFEHFLHPYPSDADKHLLSRQTGLSRNQVSNWFINARVRLWKPMVEEMYQKESKEDQAEEDRSIEEEEREEEERERNQNTSGPIAQKPMPTATTTSATATPTVTAAALENDPSLIAINRLCFSENQAKQSAINNHSSPSSSAMSTHFMPTSTTATATATTMQSLSSHHEFRHHGSMVGGAEYVTAATSGNDDVGPTLIRFGTTGGDVSLTLGLRHAGNMQEKSTPFSLRDFGAC